MNRESKRQKALKKQDLIFAQIANKYLVRVVIAFGYPEACLTPKKLDRLIKKISKDIEP